MLELTPEVFLELDAPATSAPGPPLLAGLLGIAAAAIAPALSGRKLTRMDVAATLPVME